MASNLSECFCALTDAPYHYLRSVPVRSLSKDYATAKFKKSIGRCAVARTLWLVLAAGLLIGFATQDAAKKDLTRLEGLCSFARVEVDGTKQPDVPFATHKMMITNAGEY